MEAGAERRQSRSESSHSIWSSSCCFEGIRIKELPNKHQHNTRTATFTVRQRDTSSIDPAVWIACTTNSSTQHLHTAFSSLILLLVCSMCSLCIGAATRAGGSALPLPSIFTSLHIASGREDQERYTGCASHLSLRQRWRRANLAVDCTTVADTLHPSSAQTAPSTAPLSNLPPHSGLLCSLC